MKFLKYAIPLILTFLGFLIYSNVLHGPFIFDDEENIVNNNQAHNISNFLKDFSGTRYVGFLSFALNYYFGGLNTFGYHLVNIVIHILNAILVYILVSLTFKTGIGKGIGKDKDISLSIPLPAFIAFAVSLIFLVHPIQTQAVSYITQRFTSLATFFYLLALVLYVKYRLWAIAMGNGQWEKPITYRLSPIAYCLSIIFTIFAMKTKEISFTLPFIIALYEFTFFRNKDSRPITLNSRLLYLLPFFLTLFIIPMTLLLPEYMDALSTGSDVGKIIREGQLRDIATIPAAIYLLTQFRVIITYIRLLFFPANQTFWYDYPLSYSILEPAAFFPLIFLLSVIAFAVYLYIRSQKMNNSYGILISFGILWFFITLSVESSVIPINDAIFEHRIYLPSVGFILSATAAISCGFDYPGKKIKKSLHNYLLFIIIIIAIALSFFTYKRNILWGDGYMMYVDNAAKSPNRTIVRYNLGIIYERQGKPENAMNEYLFVLNLNPYDADAHNNLANIYAGQDRLDMAIDEYKAVLRINPKLAHVYYSLGVAYFKQGRIDDAIIQYLIALRLKPFYPEAYNNLGNAYAEQNKFDKAIKEYLKALEFNPNYANAYYNLGNAYYNQGRLDDAAREYLTALKINPKETEAHNNLGFVYYTLGRMDEAIKEYLTALELKPNYVDAHYNLGIAYKTKGLKEEAIKEFKTALKLKPDLKEAQEALEEVKGNHESRVVDREPKP